MRSDPKPRRTQVTPKASTPPVPAKTRTPKATSPSRRARSPALPVPSVPRRITDDDRAAFARKGFNGILRHFREAAVALNRAHAHARITIRKEGNDAFVCEALVYDERRSLARIRVRKPEWGSAWHLVYETANGYMVTLASGEPYFSEEQSVRVEDEAGGLRYRATRAAFAGHRYDTEKPVEVARLFWERFTAPLEWIVPLISRAALIKPIPC